MPLARPRTAAFRPTCAALETRLAPSGNVWSHSLAELTRAEHRLIPHHAAERSAVRGDSILGRALPVHNDHVATHQAR